MARKNSIGLPYNDPTYQAVWREVNKERLAAQRKIKYDTFWSIRRLRRGYWLNKYKVAKGCEICGYNTHAVALDFDHLDPSDKRWNISHRLERSKLTTLLEEVRKCRVLCANCHRIETHKGR